MAESHDLFRQTLAATGDRIAALKAVRVRFGLDLRQAKEVMLQAEGTAASVDEHEERIAVALEQAIAEQRQAEPGSVVPPNNALHRTRAQSRPGR